MTWGRRRSDNQAYKKSSKQTFARLGTTRAETGVKILGTKRWKPHRATATIENAFIKSTSRQERYYPAPLEPSFLLSDGTFGRVGGLLYHADNVDLFRKRLDIPEDSKDFTIDALGEFLDKTGIIRTVAFGDGKSFGFMISAPPSVQQLKAIRNLEEEGFEITYEFRFLPERGLPSLSGDSYRELVRDISKLKNQYDFFRG